MFSSAQQSDVPDPSTPPTSISPLPLSSWADSMEDIEASKECEPGGIPTGEEAGREAGGEMAVITAVDPTGAGLEPQRKETAPGMLRGPWWSVGASLAHPLDGGLGFLPTQEQGQHTGHGQEQRVLVGEAGHLERLPLPATGLLLAEAWLNPGTQRIGPQHRPLRCQIGE